MNFSASNLPMLFPGYPERMLQWFERLHSAVALHAKFHKDLVREREYQPRPTVVVTAEELNAIEVNPLIKKQLETRYALHEARLQQMEDSKRDIFDFIWSHLSDRSQEWVRKHLGDDLDPNAPLALIRSIEHTHSLKNFSGVRSQDRYDAIQCFRNLKQYPRESIFEFKRRFEACLTSLATADASVPTRAELVTEFLHKLDDKRFGQLTADIVNGVVEEPDTYEDLAAIAERRHEYISGRVVNSGMSRTSAAFATKGPKEDKAKGDKKDKRPGKDQKRQQSGEGDECWLCGERGHRMLACPRKAEAKSLLQQEQKTFYTRNPDDTGDGSPYLGYVVKRAEDPDEAVSHMGTAGEGRFEVLLDTQATCHLIRDRALLRNVEELANPVRFDGIGGSSRVRYSGYMPYFGRVYHDPSAPVNILAFSVVEDAYSVEYEPRSYLRVHVSADKAITFHRVNNGMYIATIPPVPHAFVSLVSDREALYDKRQVAAARRARDFLRRAGFPSLQTAIQMLRSGMVPDTDITAQDLYRANAIYGNEIAIIKGKHKERKEKPLPDRYEAARDLPVQRDQVLFADIAAVEGTRYLVSISVPLGLIIVSSLTDKTTKTIATELHRFVQRYTARGFAVTKVVTDSEECFAAASPALEGAGIALEHSPPNKHVHKIEVTIRIVKERARAILHSLPYTLPRKLLPNLVLFVTARLNASPCSTRVDPTPPREIFLNRKSSMKTDFKIGFGELTLVDNPGTVKNSMAPRAREAISLNPAAHTPGAFHFFLLDTQEIVVRSSWVGDVPFTAAIVDRINQIARSDEDVPQEVGKKGGGKKVRFAYQPTTFGSSLPVDGYDVALSHIPRGDIPRGVDDQDRASPGGVVPVDAPTGNDTNETSSSDRNDNSAPDDPPHSDRDVDPNTPDDGEQDLDDDERVDESVVQELQDEADTLEQPWSHSDHPDHPDPDHVAARTRYRGQRHVPVYLAHQAERCFQMGLGPAVKRYGDQAIDSVIKELRQMESKAVWSPVKTSDLSHDQRKKIIRSYLFIREKHDASGAFEKLKSRLVAGGDSQDPSLYPDRSSPAADVASVFVVAAIAARESRHVVTADITGAYLNADMSKSDIHMKLDAAIARHLIGLDPAKYSPYITTDGGIVVRLRKALYGCLESGKLWFDTLSGALLEMGFAQNPHEKCLFNKVENENQLTVLVYVDDLMITCVDEDIIERFLNTLIERFKELTINRGEVHSYLGMSFDFRSPPKVIVGMSAYIDDMLRAAGTTGRAASPASPDLFKITEKVKVLTMDQRKSFHSMVAKALYLAKRTRPDILTAISFLTTRVREPTEEDERKLDRVLKYLNGTRTLNLTLERDEGPCKAYIDASFGVHPDMKSHSGLVASVGKGAIFVASSKQRLTTKSTTEAELVAISDKVGHALWINNLVYEQEKYKKKNREPITLFEDNQSCIALTRSGKPSSSKSRHIDIRYFFVKDRIDRKEINLTYLPTEQMVADLLTKPVQGSLFRNLRANLLNCADSSVTATSDDERSAGA